MACWTSIILNITCKKSFDYYTFNVCIQMKYITFEESRLCVQQNVILCKENLICKTVFEVL